MSAAKLSTREIWRMVWHEFRCAAGETLLSWAVSWLPEPESVHLAAALTYYYDKVGVGAKSQLRH